MSDAPATAPLALSPVDREYTLMPVGYAARLDAKAAKMGKRLAKLGAPAPVVTYGPTISVRETDEITGREWFWLAFETVTVTGYEARIAEWKPISSLDHSLVEDEALVALFPSAIEAADRLPDAFRFRGPLCDHCGIKIRTRKTTVVFRHTDGTYRQVGTSCILEYIGVDPRTLLTLMDSGSIADTDEMRTYVKRIILPAELIAAAAELTLLDGFVSASADYGIPTKDAALDYLNAKPKELADRFADVDIARGNVKAAEILAWLTDSDETSDFMVSARLACRANEATSRTFGILAALPFVYEKAMGRIAERVATKPSEFIGAIGEKLSVEGVVTTAMTIDTAYGVSRRVTVKTDDGNLVTTFGSGASLWDAETGERVVMAGKIKDHDESKYGKQTVLKMVKISVMEPAA